MWKYANALKKGEKSPLWSDTFTTTEKFSNGIVFVDKLLFQRNSEQINKTNLLLSIEMSIYTIEVVSSSNSIAMGGLKGLKALFSSTNSTQLFEPSCISLNKNRRKNK